MTTNQQLAKALGGSCNGKWYNICGPGHGSGDRSLGFRLDPHEPYGLRISSFAGDDPDICRHHILNKLSSLSEGDLSAVKRNLPMGDDQADASAAKASLIWHAAVRAVGTPVENYLFTRGCLSAVVDCLTDVVRFHPNCPMGTETVPAMVSMMRDVITGQSKGIHRTALAEDGSGKRTMPNGVPAKMMMGRAKGAAVMLSNSVPVMGIAEGIETALSARKIFGIPVWACMSAPGIAGFPVIRGIAHLTIFADHDEAGLKAAKNCAWRYQKSGIDAEVRHPREPGDDWNSFLLKETT
jgi:putative DNA primase/helicase